MARYCCCYELTYVVLSCANYKKKEKWIESMLPKVKSDNPLTREAPHNVTGRVPG